MLSENVNVLWVARYDYQAGWVLEEHYHNYYQIIYIINGLGEFYHDKNTYNIKAESLYLIRPGIYHGLQAESKESIKTFDIKFQINSKELESKLREIKSVHYGVEAKSVLEHIRMEGLKKRHLFQEFSSLYLYKLLLLLLREDDSQSNEGEELSGLRYKGNPVIDKFVEYIKSNYQQNLKLKEIAGVLGYTESYICHSFKKSCNKSPMQFLYQYRINRAKEMIIYSDYSLKHIATMTGFKTIHHFTKTFSRYIGSTPGVFRDKERRGICKNIYLTEDFQNVNKIKKKLYF